MLFFMHPSRLATILGQVLLEDHERRGKQSHMFAKQEQNSLILVTICDHNQSVFDAITL
jgi:hypothetical protein